MSPDSWGILGELRWECQDEGAAPYLGRLAATTPITVTGTPSLPVACVQVRTKETETLHRGSADCLLFRAQHRLCCAPGTQLAAGTSPSSGPLFTSHLLLPTSRGGPLLLLGFFLRDSPQASGHCFRVASGTLESKLGPCLCCHSKFTLSFTSGWFVVVVQLLSCVRLFATPWTAAL